MNKKIIKITIILCSLFLLIFSCEYSPSEKYYIELKKPESAPEIEIELNFTNNEKVIFYWGDQIKVSIKNTDILLHDVKFYLDEKEIKSHNDGKYFYTYINLFDDKEHLFRMELVTSSGSNSLADELGSEGFIYQSKEWILIHSDYNLIKNGNTTLNKNGVLVSWKVFDGVDFNHYKILKNSTSTEITTTNNHFQDNEYLGEDGNYYIYVIDNEGEETLWAHCKTGRNLPILKIGEKNRKPVLLWNTTNYANKIKSYKIKVKKNGSWNYLGTVNSNESSFVLNGFIFGENLSFSLQVNPLNNYNISNNSLFASYFYSDVAIPSPKIDSHYGSCSKGFVFEHDDTAFFYSSKENKYEILVTDNKFYNTFSPNLEYFLVPKENTLELYKVNNFEFIKSINIKEHISDYYPICYPEISDNGLVVISIGNKVYLYDMINEVLLTERVYDRNYKPVVSPDGNYLLLYSGNKLITNSINNDSIIELNTIIKTVGFYSYDDFKLIPDEPDKVYSFKDSYLTVRSMLDYSIKRKLFFGNKYFRDVDYTNNKVLTVESGYFYIHDFENGNLIKRIPTHISGTLQSMIFYNNIIFTSGYKYYLNN